MVKDWTRTGLKMSEKAAEGKLLLKATLKMTRKPVSLGANE